jgi:predicted outer membrane repeat protein
MHKKNRTLLFTSILALISLAISCTTTSPSSDNVNIIYVDLDATGSNDGKNWENAYNSLSDALSVAQTNSEIWVAEGTYYPTEGLDRSSSFVMKDDVDVYGGFDGAETSKDQRDWENNQTILSGDIGVKGLKTDNSIKVVIAANSIIDGFTIIDGYFSQQGTAKAPSQASPDAMPSKSNLGKGPLQNRDKALNNELGNSTKSVGHMSPSQVMSGNAASSTNGNGIIIWKVAPIIRNCVITNNESGKGAGVYIMGTSDLDNLPTFINTTISYNIASGRGGGVSIDMNSQAYFVDCIFDSNECTLGKGGAIYNDFGGSPLFENCLFINNYAQSGAAMANDGGSNPIISNCTFYNNEASEVGAALYQGTGPFNDPVVIDSIIWDNYCTQDKISVYNFNESNPTIEYSIVEGDYDGVGVLNLDPLFTDPDNLDFSFNENSPALIASHTGGQIGFSWTSLNNRSESDYQQIFDYLDSIESAPEPESIDISNPINEDDITLSTDLLYVDLDAEGNDDGSSWNDAYTSLQKAINQANAIYNQTKEEVDLWVAEGTYLSGELRSDSIILQSGVNIYGGFEGDETSLDQRDYVNNKTIISGEIGDKSIKEDNSYHVIIANDNIVLDGLVITGGYADGEGGEVYDNKGGAILNYLAGNRVIPTAEPTLGFDIEVNNVTFIDNYAQEGAAIYTYHGGNPTFNNCDFISNNAEYGGAVLDRAATNSIFNDCDFISNVAEYKGGAVFTDYGSMSSFYNCNFDQNESKTAGGAIYVIDRASQQVFNETDFYLIDDSWTNLTDIFSSVYLENCSFTNNKANTDGGALYVYEGSFAKIVNSYFTNNVSNDATVVSSNASTIYIDGDTTFENSYPADLLATGDKSSIIEE